MHPVRSRANKKDAGLPRLSGVSVARFAQAEQSVSAVAARDVFAKAKLKNERERQTFMMTVE